MPSPATSVRGSKEKIRAHLFILGKVQGVYFRHNTRIIANRFGVKGWVRNLEDGQVEAVLEGDEINVNAVLEWCHRGPPKALVNNVKIEYERYCGEFRDFSIS
ncbi:MAG: acylphosphatase [Nitrososphaeraceae archaeon]|jgi:acylphosphatase